MGQCTAGKFGPDAKAAAHVLRYLAAAGHTKPEIAAAEAQLLQVIEAGD